MGLGNFGTMVGGSVMSMGLMKMWIWELFVLFSQMVRWELGSGWFIFVIQRGNASTNKPTNKSLAKKKKATNVCHSNYFYAFVNALGATRLRNHLSDRRVVPTPKASRSISRFCAFSIVAFLFFHLRESRWFSQTTTLGRV